MHDFDVLRVLTHTSEYFKCETHGEKLSNVEQAYGYNCVLSFAPRDILPQ